MTEKDILTIGDKEIENRFFLGTGKFGSKDLMLESIKQSGVQVVTVALRRVDEEKNPENILELLLLLVATIRGIYLYVQSVSGRSRAVRGETTLATTPTSMVNAPAPVGMSPTTAVGLDR